MDFVINDPQPGTGINLDQPTGNRYGKDILRVPTLYPTEKEKDKPEPKPVYNVDDDDDVLPLPSG